MLRVTGIALLTATVMAILGCGGGSPSLPPNSPPPPPPPNISISPTSAVAGSPDLTLTVMGSNFLGETHNFSQAVWSVNSSNTLLVTTFVSSTQLTAVIPAALLSNPVTAQVLVQTGDPIGDLPLRKSNSVSFSVTTLPPSISISPTTAVAGSADLTLAITASGFAFTSDPHKFNRAVWSVNSSNTSLATTFVSSTQLTAVIPAALLSNPVTAQLFVEIWDKMGDVPDFTSNAVSFIVTSTVSGISSGFVPAGSMSPARSGHTATLLMNGKVLVAGGADASAELFDPTTGTFAPTGIMSTTRYGATATLLVNGKVLIVGGYGPGVSELPRLKTAELYDPFTGTFSPTGNMALPRVLHAATLLDDGKVLITGGTIDHVGGGTATANAEFYDPSSGTFSTVGSMTSDRAQHTATLLANGQVLIAGGWNGNRADAADDPPWDPLFAELYDAASGSFSAGGSMSTTRIGHSAIGLANGKVIILGGIPNPQNLHQPVNPRYEELYDSATNAFSPVGNLTLSQTGYSATLLTNGRILIAGGEDQGHAVGTAELLDPASGSLTATGGLVTERKGHTATLLLDGRVLVTGGVDSNGNTLATAEVYK